MNSAPKYKIGEEVNVLVKGSIPRQVIIRRQLRKGEWMYLTEIGNWYFEDELSKK